MKRIIFQVEKEIEALKAEIKLEEDSVKQDESAEANEPDPLMLEKDAQVKGTLTLVF